MFCRICGGSFDSNCKFCKECEEYDIALKHYGKTKTVRDYEIEGLVSSGVYVVQQIKGGK